jgi:hypothetical protein
MLNRNKTCFLFAQSRVSDRNRSNIAVYVTENVPVPVKESFSALYTSISFFLKII